MGLRLGSIALRNLALIHPGNPRNANRTNASHPLRRQQRGSRPVVLLLHPGAQQRRKKRLRENLKREPVDPKAPPVPRPRTASSDGLVASPAALTSERQNVRT